MGIKVKYVDNEEELNICFSIRRKVFIEEQNIPEAIEMDDISVNAKSICAILDAVSYTHLTLPTNTPV